MLVSAFEVLEHAQPQDAISGGDGDFAIEAFLRFGDEAALVSVHDVAANGNAAPAVAPRDHRLAIADLDARHLRQRNGHAVAGVDRQLPDRLDRFPRLLVEPGHDVETPLAFVERAHRFAADGHVYQFHDILDADVIARA